MPERAEPVLAGLDTQPAYCFTSDLDWAPEWMIAETLDIFRQVDVSQLTHGR